MNGASRPKAARTQPSTKSTDGTDGMRAAIVSLTDRTVYIGAAATDGPWLNLRGRRHVDGKPAGPWVELTVGPAEVRRVRYTDR